jgi:Putative transmembrane protein (Alph_Pro_TM)
VASQAARCAQALIGAYDVDLMIFAGGAPVAQTRSTFIVEKIGVAQFVATASVDHSLIYGLATMGMALLTECIASVAVESQQENSSNETFACVNDHCLMQRTGSVLPSLSQENSKSCLTVGPTSAALAAGKSIYSNDCK